uniref:F-box domain-containing protein n=1 Tax=Glossina morsitans morsitans TaxID=37546 RepID=A0A1B0FDK9_GLOMM
MFFNYRSEVHYEYFSPGQMAGKKYYWRAIRRLLELKMGEHRGRRQMPECDTIIPISIGNADLAKYFQRYGRIVALRTEKPVNQDFRYKPTKMGFVNFADAYAARNVLRKRTHFIKTEAVSVKACDTWHQPNTDLYYIETKMITNNDLIPPTASILILNDDCLEKICKYLELRDKIRFTRVCNRFYDVFIMTSKFAYKTLLLDDIRTLTLWEARFECIAKLPKLKNLELVAEIAIGPAIFIELAKHQSDQLESLTLKGLDCINSANVSFICELKKLKVLRCSDSNGLHNMWLRQLSNLSALEEMDVAGCEGITNTGLLDFLRKCRKLKRLNIIRCKQLTDEFILDACNILRIPRRQNCLSILAYGSGINQFAIDRNEIAKGSDFMKITFDLPLFESRCYDDLDDNHLSPLYEMLEEDFY